MMKPRLVCPFAAAYPKQENSDCLGEACACYVKMHKTRPMHENHCNLVDPEYFYRYVGCGLIAQVPWELVKREERQKNLKDNEENKTSCP